MNLYHKGWSDKYDMNPKQKLYMYEFKAEII